MKFRNYLTEAKRAKLKSATKSKINKDLDKVLKQTYFNKIPLKDIFNVLEKYDIVPLQEDYTYWSGILSGGRKETERVAIILGLKETQDERGMYTPISDAELIITYYIMPSGKYEVIGYVG